MKLLKSIAVCLALTAALATVASAQSTLRVTGSSAFRKATQNAEVNILIPSTVSYGYYSSSDFASASVSIIKGSTVASITGGTSYPVTFKNAWSGSVGGIRTVDQNQLIPNTTATPKINVGWLNDPGTLSSTGTLLGTSAPVATSTAYESPSHQADVAMSDGFQSSTPFVTQPLTDKLVGVVEFVFARENGSPTSITNIDQNFFKTAAVSAGSAVLSLLTGNPADSTAFIFVSGRDADSGTRLDAFAETGYGKVGQAVDQWEWLVGAASASGPFTAVDGGTDAGPNTPIGFNSGGSLANNMMAPNDGSAVGGWSIAYLGINDASSIHAGTYASATATVSGGQVTALSLSSGGTQYADPTTLKVAFKGGGATTSATATVSSATISSGVITAITFNITNGGAGYTSAPSVLITGGSPGIGSTGAADAELTFDGIPYTRNNIQQGVYPFWSYEHFLYRPIADGGAHSPVYGAFGTYDGTTGSNTPEHIVADAVATQMAVGNSNVNLVGGVATAQANDSGIILSTMKVQKGSEGGNITHK